MIYLLAPVLVQVFLLRVILTYGVSVVMREWCTCFKGIHGRVLGFGFCFGLLSLDVAVTGVLVCLRGGCYL